MPIENMRLVSACKALLEGLHATGRRIWRSTLEKHRSLIHDPSMVGGERNIIIRDWASQTVNCHSLIMYIPRFEMHAEHDFQAWENLLAAMSINIRP